MDNYIYLHHSGQFFHKNHPPKIQTAIGQKLFVNVNHEMTYSLETFDENGNQKCTNQNNNELDDCIVKVRFQITILFQIYENVSLQAVDQYYLENLGCVMPFQTLKPKEKPCNINSTMRDEYFEFFQNIVFKTHCPMPCASVEVTFPPFGYATGSPDEAYAKIYLHSIVKAQTSYWSYPIITLFAEVGGYMGLLLGISLLDINKVLHWLYNNPYMKSFY